MPEVTKEKIIDEQDILIVHNIDSGCDQVDTFYDKSGNSYEISHKDYFQVLWGGVPIRLEPGGTRRMTRAMAEHYAKHLANHVLMKMEEETNRQFLVTSPVERPKVLSQILVGVDSYFQDQDIPLMTEAERQVKEMENMNKEPEGPAMDLGEISHPTIGNLVEEPKQPDIPETGEVEPTEPTSIIDPNKPKPTRKQLMQDCAKLGIKFEISDTADDLIAKIKAF